jgi:CRP-like cAMP-binding protein
MENLESVVKRHPFWRGLDPAYFPFLVEGAGWARFEAGEVIASEGGAADHFYLLLHGKVGLEMPASEAEKVTVQLIGPGEALGWSWLFPPYQWHLTARAIEETEVIGWETHLLRKHGEENPSFGYELACRVSNLLSNRLHATHLQLMQLYRSER